MHSGFTIETVGDPISEYGPNDAQACPPADGSGASGSALTSALFPIDGYDHRTDPPIRLGSTKWISPRED